MPKTAQGYEFSQADLDTRKWGKSGYGQARINAAGSIEVYGENDPRPVAGPPRTPMKLPDAASPTPTPAPAPAPAPSDGFDQGEIARGTPTVSDQSNPTPAPNPAAPAASPTPQGMASPMQSLQAAADPGAGWQQSAVQSGLRPGLGSRVVSPMQRLLQGNPY